MKYETRKLRTTQCMNERESVEVNYQQPVFETLEEAEQAGYDQEKILRLLTAHDRMMFCARAMGKVKEVYNAQETTEPHNLWYHPRPPLQPEQVMDILKDFIEEEGRHRESQVL